ASWVRPDRISLPMIRTAALTIRSGEIIPSLIKPFGTSAWPICPMIFGRWIKRTAGQDIDSFGPLGNGIRDDLRHGLNIRRRKRGVRLDRGRSEASLPMELR